MEIEAAKKKEMVDKIAAATPSISVPAETNSFQPAQASTPSGLSTNSRDVNIKKEKSLVESPAITSMDGSKPVASESELAADAQQDVPQLSIEASSLKLSLLFLLNKYD